MMKQEFHKKCKTCIQQIFTVRDNKIQLTRLNKCHMSCLNLKFHRTSCKNVQLTVAFLSVTVKYHLVYRLMTSYHNLNVIQQLCQLLPMLRSSFETLKLFQRRKLQLTRIKPN
jgi:hypothetical protein